MIRILHTADWHLGKPFGRLPADIRAALTEARFDAIDRLTGLTRHRRIDHVIVAGDMFDNTDPGDRVVIQALARMAAGTCHWWLIPGNHDHARSDGLWARFRRRAAGNVHVLDRPEPVEIEDGAWVLPAPVQFLRTTDDPTEAMSSMTTPPGAMRIGIAHGPIVDFAARGEANNLVPADRATRSGLDYLALGDWHGYQLVNSRTAYSGTPEPDSFMREDAGAVVVAEVRPGAEPLIERVDIGRYRWLSRSWSLTKIADYEHEVRTLAGSVEMTAALLHLRLDGAVSLADCAAIRAALNDGLAHRLRWLSCDDKLMITPTDDDIASIDVQGMLAVASSRLRDIASSGGAQAERASRALERLYVEALRAGSEDAR